MWITRWDRWRWSGCGFHLDRHSNRAGAALVVAVVLLVLVAGAGLGKTKVITKTVPSTTPKKTVPSTVPSATNPIVLQGSGNASTQPFSLTAGLAIFVLKLLGRRRIPGFAGRRQRAHC